MDVDGEAKDPGRYRGMVGTISKTCCAVALRGRAPVPGVTTASGAFITACTRASCDIPSCQLSGPVLTMLVLRPRPSQRQCMSFPGMIWHKRPVSTCRISMNLESNNKIYGG